MPTTVSPVCRVTPSDGIRDNSTEQHTLSATKEDAERVQQVAFVQRTKNQVRLACIWLGSVMCLYNRSSCSEICTGPLSTTVSLVDSAISTEELAVVAAPSPDLLILDGTGKSVADGGVVSYIHTVP